MRILWKIENFSYCLHRKREVLNSPEFVLGCFGSSKWKLELYPRGDGDVKYIPLRLYKFDGGESSWLDIDFELSFQTSDDSPNICYAKADSWKDSGSKYGQNCTGFASFALKEEVCIERKDSFLKDDVLTIQCRMRRSYTDFEKVLIVIKTCINVERLFCIWNITDFSQPKTEKQSKLVPMVSVSKRPILTLVSTGGIEEEERFAIEISQTNAPRRNLTRCKMFIIDAKNEAMHLASDDHWFEQISGEQVWRFPLMISKDKLMELKDILLPNDTLTLQCHYSISQGDTSNSIERVIEEGMDTELANNFLKTFPQPVLGASSNDSNSLCEDLNTLFESQEQSDFTLLAEGKIFKTHKNILSARSSVFKAMFQNEMVEKVTNSLELVDLDADTVQRMLMFIYSDNMEELQLEEAKKLLYAADKYQILLLKRKCSDLLKANLNVSNVCEVLVLSDLYHDEDLKKASQYFMFHHEGEVLISEEWKNFVAENSELAVDTILFIHVNRADYLY